MTVPSGGLGSRDVARLLPLRMDEVRVDPALALRIPSALALRREVLPFLAWHGRVHVACVNALDGAALAVVQRSFECPVQAVPAEAESLRRLIATIHANGRGGGSAPSHGVRAGARELAEGGDASDAAGLSDQLVREAALRQASDLHVDPGPTDVRVRVRVDGVLEE